MKQVAGDAIFRDANYQWDLLQSMTQHAKKRRFKAFYQ
jgi:hypothetical protein